MGAYLVKINEQWQLFKAAFVFSYVILAKDFIFHILISL